MAASILAARVELLANTAEAEVSTRIVEGPGTFEGVATEALAAGTGLASAIEGDAGSGLEEELAVASYLAGEPRSTEAEPAFGAARITS